MKLVHMWAGSWGRYEVPAAIIWLADKANELAGLPPVANATLWCAHIDRYASPGHKVIKEWGDWRNDEERKRLMAEAA